MTMCLSLRSKGQLSMDASATLSHSRHSLRDGLKKNKKRLIEGEKCIIVLHKENVVLFFEGCNMTFDPGLGGTCAGGCMFSTACKTF